MYCVIIYIKRSESMKNTVSKGILFYLFVLLSIIVGVLCIFAGIMVLSPGTEIFGFSYTINNAYNYYIKAEVNQGTGSATSKYIDDLISEGKIEKFVIETQDYDIFVCHEKIEKTEFIVKNNYSGIVKNGNRKKAEITFLYNESEKVCSIKVVEPECSLTFSSGSKVTLALPDSIDMQKVSLDITTKTGQISLGNTESFEHTFNNLCVKGTNSKISLNKNVDYNGNISINTNGGEIYLVGEKKVADFEIKTDSAKIEIGNIISPETRINSNSSVIKITKILGNVYFDSKSGVVNVGYVEGKFECSEDVKISNITIGEIHGEVLLPMANTSNISITKCYADCRIKTTSGNVKIEKMYANADIETESGSVEIDFVPDTILTDKAPDKPMASISTTSGNITANFDDVLKDNTITTNSGNVKVGYNNNRVFDLEYNCAEKTPKLPSGLETGTPEKSHTYQIGGGSSVNTLSISITKNGQLTIDDTYKAE